MFAPTIQLVSATDSLLDICNGIVDGHLRWCLVVNTQSVLEYVINP